MPLPSPNQPWPPKPLADLLPVMATWAAWYAGDPDVLTAIYGGSNPGTDLSGFYASEHGGFKGAVTRTIRRWFWGEPARGPERRTKLHVPIASDLCQASADLLFADPPTLTVDGGNTKTAERLEDLAGDGLYTQLAESAEIAAALGGVYLRVTWDESVEPDAPFLTSVHADAAWPEFRYGRLVGVTFWRIVARDDKRVWRHVERHELDYDRVGVVLHGLYEGTQDNLGMAIPLTEIPATAGFAAYVDENSAISTLTPDLAVAYVPNQRPHRKWRSHPLGSSLGRSDLDGVEGLMDALDETYTSWMRDLRLGKGRVFLAQSMLRDEGPGRGQSWDAEQEVYAPLNMLPSAAGSGMPMLAQQFAIRVDEHRATSQDIIEQILRTTGYSAQTFGEDEGSRGAATATEVESREHRSLLTRDRKIRLWRSPTEEIISKLLAVDGAVFGGPAPADVEVDVTFGDGVAESLGELAATVNLLNQAGAASTKTKVALVHPDWDDEQISAEVELIDSQSAVPDPGLFRPGIDATSNGAPNAPLAL